MLLNKNLPLWASCGGAQGLAILAEVGVDHRWDCPHCRDPLAPQTPIYTHIGSRDIYAAQFHIEMERTTENSRRIMGNFLAMARHWGGYNPKGAAD
jgi:hypothetical protein